MFIPDYIITNKILNNIGRAEYCKAVIDNSPLLPAWEKQLKKEALLRTIEHSLRFKGYAPNSNDIRKYLDGLISNTYPEVTHLKKVIDYTDSEVHKTDLHEKDLRIMNSIITHGQASPLSSYRRRRSDTGSDPEEILAEMVSLMDWYNSLDAKETHPLLLAGILKAKVEMINPFEQSTFTVSNTAARASLKTNGFHLNGYYSLEEFYFRTQGDYRQAHRSIQRDEGEMTEWLEYFTEGFAKEATNIKEKVLLTARDTKVAKASGRVKLTARQERIVEYLQDYGILQNKDFSKVFPDISEDSVLRDLKILITMGIAVKTGSTKSSRYELS